MKYRLDWKNTARILDRELDEVKYFDAGDIPLPFGNPQSSLDMIEEFVRPAFSSRKNSHLVWAESI